MILRLAVIVLASMLLPGCATFSALAIVGASAAVVGASANVYRATHPDRIVVDQQGRIVGVYRVRRR